MAIPFVPGQIVTVSDLNSLATSAALETEISRATGAEGVLTTNLASEITRATAAEGVLTTNLAASVIRSNDPAIALFRYRSIPASTTRKIAWVGDSTTSLLFTTAMGSYTQILSSNDGGQYITNKASFLTITTITDGGGASADVLESSLPHGLRVRGYIYSNAATGVGLPVGLYRVLSTPTSTSFTLANLSGVAQSALTPGTGLSIIFRADNYSQDFLSQRGQPFYNIQHGDFGVNGGSLANFVAGNSAPASINDVIAFAPDLIVMSYGINDVRLGTTSQTQLETLIDTAVNTLKTALPNADIILRMPNSLLYDAANTNTYINAPTSLAKVQGYSDILRTAYRNKKGKYSNTWVLDTQGEDTQIVSEIVQSVAGFYMSSNSDALHPSGNYYAAMLREVCYAIGNFDKNRYIVFNQNVQSMLPTLPPTLSRQATLVNPTSDYLVQPRVLEDKSKYNQIWDGNFQNGSPGTFLDLGNNSSIIPIDCINAFKVNDIFLQYGHFDTVGGSQSETIENGNSAWKLTTLSRAAQGNFIRFTSTPVGYPHLQSASGLVKVFRPRPATQKNDYDPNLSLSVQFVDFAPDSFNGNVPRAGLVSSMVLTMKTNPTLAASFDVKIRGTIVATITVSTAGVIAYSGTFFTAGTKGDWLDENDQISVVKTAGAGGSGVVINFATNNTYIPVNNATYI